MRKSLSAIALDRCHEQNNAVFKGTGDAVGLTKDHYALGRFMVAGPEISRITTNFEGERFAKDVESLVGVIDQMGIPFLEEGNDLLVLDPKDIVDASVAEAVKKARSQIFCTG